MNIPSNDPDKEAKELRAGAAHMLDMVLNEYLLFDVRFPETPQRTWKMEFREALLNVILNAPYRKSI